MARKIAAINIWNNHDYGILAVSGADKVMMAQKIENWKFELEDLYDSLRSFETF